MKKYFLLIFLIIIFSLNIYSADEINASLKVLNEQTDVEGTARADKDNKLYIVPSNTPENPMYFQNVGASSTGSVTVDTIYIRHYDTFVFRTDNYETIFIQAVIPDTVLSKTDDIYSDSIVSVDFVKIVGDTVTKTYVDNLFDGYATDTELEQDRQNLSAGAVHIPNLTNNGNGSIIIGDTGTFRLFSDDKFDSAINLYSISGDSFTLVNDTTNYIVADYNGGTPIIRNTVDVLEINESTIIPLYTIIRKDNFITRLNWNSMGKGLSNKLHRRFVKTDRFRIQTGLTLSEVGTRNLVVDTGVVWYGSKEVNTEQVNTTDTTQLIWLFRKSNGADTWDVELGNTYNNLWYQNGNDTAEVLDNEYVVNFVYRNADEQQKNIGIVLGTESYNFFEAEKAQIPDELPQTLRNIGVFVGKVIVRKGQDVASLIQQYTTATDLIESVDSNRFQIESTYAGTLEDQPKVSFTVTDTQILACLENVNGGNITVNLDGIEYVLEPDTVVLSIGDSTTLQINNLYVGLNGSSADFKVSTTLPSDTFAWVGKVAVFDTQSTIDNGVLMYQRYTDSLKYNFRGRISHISEKIRVKGADWWSGVNSELDITVNGSDWDTVQLDVTSGVVYQMHRQNFVPDTSFYYVVNYPGEPYKKVTHLGEIDVDALGNSLRANNTYYGLEIFGSQNSQDFDGNLFVLLPTDFYSIAANAISDASNYSITTVPSELRQTAFRMCRVVLRAQSGQTLTNVLSGNEVQDRRNYPFGIGGGGLGSATSTVFSDAQFELYNNTIASKIGKFNLSNLTTSTTRTLSFPDKNGTIKLEGDTTDFNLVVGDTVTKTYVNDTLTNNYLSKSNDDTAEGKIIFDDDVRFNSNVFTDALFSNGTDTITIWNNIKMGTGLTEIRNNDIYSGAGYFESDGGMQLVLTEQGTGRVQMEFETDTGSFIAEADDNPFNFEIRNKLSTQGSGLVVDNSGSVGIKTAYPVYDLDVNGNIGAVDIFADRISGAAAIQNTSQYYCGGDMEGIVDGTLGKSIYVTDRVTINHTGTSTNNEGTFYRCWEIPDDFHSFFSDTSVVVETIRDGAADSFVLTMRVDAVADTSINNVNILPTADNTFEIFGFGISDTDVYQPGQRVMFRADNVVDSAEEVGLGKIVIYYKRINTKVVNP